MTLKELITKVDFDELLPYLKELIPENLDNLHSFREAYDILRSMEPDKNFQGVINVSMSDEEDSYNGERYVQVSHLNDTSWEKDLAKKIVLDDNVSVSDEELAMHCLWEITFYGFSPQNIEDNFDRMCHPTAPRNIYEVALDKLEESIWKRQTPRRLRCKDKNGRRLITLSLGKKNSWELFNKVSLNPKMNRAKRKREYRQTQRMQYLERMAFRENMILMLSSNGSSFHRSNLGYLLRVDYGAKYDYFSVTCGREHRLDYILKSITDYQEIDLSAYNNAVIGLFVSPDYPLDESELIKFKKKVTAWLGLADVRFGVIRSESEKPDVRMMLLLNKVRT